MPTLPQRCGVKAAVSLAFMCLLFATSSACADIPRIEADAERGSVQKQIQLGAAYFLGRGVQRSEEMAAFWYEKAANSGDPVAQEEIGYFYQAGIGVPRDPARAAHWFQLAAAGGRASAKVNLGVAYLWGLGVPRNQALALQLFHEALEKGSAVAAGYIGEAYFLGIGVAKDVSAAQHWYAIGAKTHDPHAQFRLAGFLSTDAARPEHISRASTLLRTSSKAGYVPAKHALGLLIVNHPELAARPNEAIQNLEEAAAAGTWKSSAVLGILARDGRGMTADTKSAYVHFKVAEIQGGDSARPLVAADLSRLAATLSDADVQSLNAQANDWVERHKTQLQFVYGAAAPAFALTSPDLTIHAGRLMPNPD
jgi:hypothetical protein